MKTGLLLARRRIGDDAAGLAALLDLLATHGDSGDAARAADRLPAGHRPHRRLGIPM
jgi:hypothetical protein